jgi:hypothetical protein
MTGHHAEEEDGHAPNHIAAGDENLALA